ncbi:hypothetical protein JW813_09115 [Clostridium botulinum]|uniref:hypothetical protein n=1 Tax=Clostridium botulinum TaxID=1491 RepID=UPI0021AF98B3|nr:hypothetical protein [Clostridium botulinum]UZP01898.1 hypothetical protein JW813_09115 [Clostridium botulinum]UZP05256.1 hypothetical protein JYA71_09385 [Clostridium botulinum]UZP08637.1 hypothetical protein JYA74_09110 [Clostridium botulinum]
MGNKLKWNHDKKIVYGRKSDFKSKIDFINAVKYEHKQITKYDCYIDNITLKVYIITEEGLEKNTFVPISNTDIDISTMYCGNFYTTEGLSGNF